MAQGVPPVGGLLAVRGWRLLTAQTVPSPTLRRTAYGTGRANGGALLAVRGARVPMAQIVPDSLSTRSGVSAIPHVGRIRLPAVTIQIEQMFYCYNVTIHARP